MIKYMLDTNIVIYTIKNKPSHVKQVLQQNYNQVCISTVTLMELYFGVEKSAKPEQNLQDVEGFVARVDVVDYDAEAAFHTGQIRSALAKLGKPIGPYDQMLAGHARSAGLVLVTNNEKEFSRVPGMLVENWA